MRKVPSISGYDGIDAINKTPNLKKYLVKGHHLYSGT
jgi:hypothetical protein